MNKKYLLFSFLFLASISLHSFDDHQDLFGSTEEYTSDCQASEDNLEINISKTKPSRDFLENSPKTNLLSRFVNFESKSNLSRAPPSK